MFRQLRPFATGLAVGLSAAAALFLAGCPDDPPACQDTICTAGAASCAGNGVRICADDGKSYNFSGCGSAQYCSNGTCVARACTNLGGGTCQDTSTLLQCDTDGATTNTVNCSASEVCAGGACVPNTCTDGDTRCGDAYAVLTCTAGAWVETLCSGGQVCDDDGSGGKACSAPACIAQTASCDGNVSVTCNHDGTVETRTACASNEVCDSGYCRGKVCGEVVDTPDVVSDVPSDAGDDATPDTAPDVGPEIPPLEPIPVLKFQFGLVSEDFDLSVRADFNPTPKALVIQGGKGGRRIEITLAPIEPGTLNLFSDTDATDTVVTICYLDGQNPSAMAVGPCAAGFSHYGYTYMLDLTSNNGPGSRVKGTFSAVMRDAGENETPINNGEFDVKHF